MEAADRRAYHSAQVMSECGFTDTALAAVKRHRMAGSVQEALDRTQVSDMPVPHWSETAPPESIEWRVLREARAKNALMNGGDML